MQEPSVPMDIVKYGVLICVEYVRLARPEEVNK